MSPNLPTTICLFAEQFDQLQDELERRREECIQLRTVLANVSLNQDQNVSIQQFHFMQQFIYLIFLEPQIPDLKHGPTSELPEAEELFTAYETQKSVIATLQEQLSDEKARAKELEGELKAELGKLNKTCGEQQQVINQVINKGPANQVEACLQHEISRLTGENIDLQEKIEGLQETIKRLKRQLKAYMKKLNEVGAALPEVSPMDVVGDLDPMRMSNGPSDMPMVRKKEHDFLGMFEYKKEQEQQVLKALIYGKHR